MIARMTTPIFERLHSLENTPSKQLQAKQQVQEGYFFIDEEDESYHIIMQEEKLWSTESKERRNNRGIPIK